MLGTSGLKQHTNWSKLVELTVQDTLTDPSLATDEALEPMYVW